MLTHLHIQNFIIIQNLELEFSQGLTVITGETGAGKSIIIDALALILGGRADNNVIGNFQNKCDLTACFSIGNIPLAIQWLNDHHYAEEFLDECIIRRILNKDGKSRQMINGINCTLQQLKEFLPYLINIHSQNQQQLLTKRNHQRELVDCFGHHDDFCQEVKNCYMKWSEVQNKIKHFEQLRQKGIQQELLEYQLEEFEKNNLMPGEYETLDNEHKLLANADELLRKCQDALMQLSETEKSSAQGRLYQAKNHLQGIQHLDPKISNANELIHNAIIHLDEATTELRSYIDQVEINPERLALIETRISKLHELARKYHTTPQLLSEVHQDLKKRLAEFHDANQIYDTLQKTAEFLKQNYRQAADLLSKKRLKTIKILNQRISDEIQNLGMPGGVFKAVLNTLDEITLHGSDEIEFLVSANPGQPLLPLAKVASGGEISRIALAIYVATAETKTTPILVFDEVDVGIGGATAAIVAKLLKTLSQSAQVLCITHLPQVAAQGKQHFCVQKEIMDDQTITNIVELGEDQRIQEIARMLGGIKITEKTLAHASELIASE